MIKIKSRKEYFELSRARRRIVLIFVLGLFITLFAQAIKLAAFEKNKLQKESRQRQLRVIDLIPYRGKILDRNGALLAESTPVYSIMADATILNFKHKDSVIQTKLYDKKKRLATLLKLSTKDLDKRIQNKKRRSVHLRKNITPDVKAKIMSNNVVIVIP